ncbi:MAG: sigma-70 family RNA polymerase sigma factor [Geodermatophilaceae bacterium]
MQPWAPTDEELAARTAAGDLAAFTLLYDRHEARVHVWASHALGRHAGEDAVQEVFLRVWRHAGQFDVERGRFVTWLMAITRHHLARELDRRGRSGRVMAAAEIESLLTEGASGFDVEQETFRRVRAVAVLRELKLLPEEQRRVIVLAYFAGMTESEIARQLELPLGTVKKRVRLAMHKLRKALDAEVHDPPDLRVVRET